MESIDNIRKSIGYYLLKNQAKKVVRKKTFHNFDSAKTVSIIFNALKQESYIIAKNFITFLENKKISVYALGYVANKEAIGYFPHQKGVHFFAINDVNWYYKPLSPEIESFTNQGTDLLIDISLNENIIIHYIIGLSKAKCKVTMESKKAKFSDFTLDLKEYNDVEFFIEQLKHYMIAISKK